jgi:hypothetical protein
MAQMPVRLIRNLLFLFETDGKALEPVGQRQELIPTARFETELLGYPPERLGDTAEIRNPGLRRGFVHHSTAGCSHPLTSAKSPVSDSSRHAGYAGGPLAEGP